MAVQTVDGYKAAELIGAGAVAIDVREAEDFAAGHIQGAVHLPFVGVSEASVAAVAPDKSAPVVVYCYVGGRSAALAQWLDGVGYEQVYNLGGIGNWPFELSAD